MNSRCFLLLATGFITDEEEEEDDGGAGVDAALGEAFDEAVDDAAVDDGIDLDEEDNEDGDVCFVKDSSSSTGLFLQHSGVHLPVLQSRHELLLHVLQNSRVPQYIFLQYSCSQ